MGTLQNTKIIKIVIPTFIVLIVAAIGISQLLFSSAATPSSTGDLNGDGRITHDDVGLLVNTFGTADITADLNQDGTVDILDLSILLGNMQLAQNPEPSTTGVQAARSTDFTDTVGINLHINYFNTAYGDWNSVKQKLAELHIKQVRGSSYWNFAEADRRQDELRAMGIHVNMILDAGNFNEQVAYLKTKPSGFVSGVESLNEPDCFLVKENPSGWVEETRRLQADAYTALKQDPALGNIPVLSTSYCRSNTNGLVGDLSQYYDYINAHPYPGGLAPEDRTAASVDEIRKAYGTKPMSATETGYHTAVQFVDGGGVSEQAAATYIPRLYLTYYQAGFKRTYLYELLEQRPGTWITATFDRDNHFGLYRSNFTPKPAADTVRRMMTLLSDDSTREFSPGRLDYTISGDTNNLQQQLFQKSNGLYYLVLWRKDTIWNVATRSAITVPAKPLRVNLKQSAQQVKTYAIGQSDEPTSTSSGNGYDLNLGPDVQILEIKP